MKLAICDWPTSIVYGRSLQAVPQSSMQTLPEELISRDVPTPTLAEVKNKFGKPGPGRILFHIGS